MPLCPNCLSLGVLSCSQHCVRSCPGRVGPHLTFCGWDPAQGRASSPVSSQLGLICAPPVSSLLTLAPSCLSAHPQTQALRDASFLLPWMGVTISPWEPISSHLLLQPCGHSSHQAQGPLHLVKVGGWGMGDFPQHPALRLQHPEASWMK